MNNIDLALLIDEKINIIKNKMDTYEIDKRLIKTIDNFIENKIEDIVRDKVHQLVINKIHNILDKNISENMSQIVGSIFHKKSFVKELKDSITYLLVNKLYANDLPKSEYDVEDE